MKDFAGISAQALSDTIGAIYDCALDPEYWPGALARMGQLSESPSGGICIHDLAARQEFRLFEFGYPNGFTERYEEYSPESPFALAASTQSVGDVRTIADLCSEEELLESRFYRQLLEPFGYFDFIGLLALKTGARVASMHASRTRGAPPYGAREVELFRLLAPHVSRAVAISDALDVRTLRSEALEATLDGLVAGVYLAARDGRIVYMNASAVRQARTGTALRVVGNRLVPNDQAARVALANAIADASRDIVDGEHALAIPEKGGVGYVATLLPLEHGRRRSIVAPFAASVAIFTQEPTQVPLMPGEAFARLYGLTGGELRVSMALAQGLGAKEAAEMLGISEPTVRTHLQHMFLKTGTSRQAELLHLLQSSAPPVIAHG
ncbi:MAG: helix-turn-helix transcriptional regulator [Dongiaceae bacterium]